MLFNIDSDHGSRIEGWIMPDNPSVTPTVQVVIDGEAVATVKAQILRPLLREQGLHETGVCGFLLDGRNITGLAVADDIEIYDSDTNVRIYRRRPLTAKIEAKLFRLETQVLRNAVFNEALEPLFHMAFTKLEALPEETAKSILGLPFTASNYVTGRVHFRVFDALLRDRGFKPCVVLRDPLEELAEQLLLLRWASARPKQALKGVLHESMLGLVEMIDPNMSTEVGQLESWLMRLSARARHPLTDPLTRLLTCLSPDDRAVPHAAADALDSLADFAAVGFRADIEGFSLHLEAALDSELPRWTLPETASRVVELAAQLGRLEIVRQMLATDLEVYAAAQEAWMAAKVEPASRF